MKTSGSLFAGLALAFTAAVGLSVCAANPFDLRTEMTVAEFTRCGLTKLSDSELEALGAWIERRSGAARSRARSPSAAQLFGESAAEDPLVSFNVSTHRFHCPTCRHAIACTRNCREVPLSEALARGGEACKVCGGVCRAN